MAAVNRSRAFCTMAGMTNATAHLNSLVHVDGAALEVTASEPSHGPLILAAHPADDFGAPTATLLRDASRASVVCVNPRGVGRSSPGLTSLEQIADDLEAVRQQRALGPVVFWGMSGGGWLGLAYAHRHRQALAGLVLESVCPCFRLRLADPACLLSPFHPAWRSALEARGLVGHDAHEEAPDRTEWISVPGVGSVLGRAAGPALLVSPEPLSERMSAILPTLLAFDARPCLRTLDVPTLVMAGDADPIVPLSHARGLADGLATELVVIPGAGHVPTAQGRPEAHEAVRRFLATLVSA